MSTQTAFGTSANLGFGTINYNDYYSPGTGRVGGFLNLYGSGGVTDFTTIAAWRAATQGNAAPLTANPQFLSQTDLRPAAGSPLLGAGQTIPGVHRSTSWATRAATRRRSARTRTPVGLRLHRRRHLRRHHEQQPPPPPPPPPQCTGGSITINDLTTATPYPSTCVVSGVSGTVSDVNVNLDGMSHTFPDDVDMLLVSPDGQNAIFMSDAGGGTDIVSCNLTLDDEAAIVIPDATALACPGSYKPANYEPGDPFPAPAPTPSGSVNLSTFDGGTTNGTWSLYIVDDASGDSGRSRAGR